MKLCQRRSAILSWQSISLRCCHISNKILNSQHPMVTLNQSLVVDVMQLLCGHGRGSSLLSDIIQEWAELNTVSIHIFLCSSFLECKGFSDFKHKGNIDHCYIDNKFSFSLGFWSNISNVLIQAIYLLSWSSLSTRLGCLFFKILRLQVHSPLSGLCWEGQE